MVKSYRILVHWKSGLTTTAASSDDPTLLAGAPTVSRNPRAIRRIELHDRSGCLEAIWDASWST